MNAGTVWLGAALLVLGGGCGGDDDGGGRDAGGSTTDAGADAGADGGTGAECIAALDECTAPGGDECCEGLVCRSSSSSARAFCVALDDTCFVGAESGCCLDDADCEGEDRCLLSECRHDGDGVCKPPPAEGECWTTADCGAGETCTDATICPCGVSCVAPDMPGSCG